MGIKSFFFRRNANKRIYLERRNIKVFACTSIAALLLISLLGSLLFILSRVMDIIDKCVRQGYIINQNIMAQTISELKEYDMRLVRNDLKASA